MLFPVEKLHVKLIEWSLSTGSLSIILKLAPFEYNDGTKTYTEETTVILSEIKLGKLPLHALSGKVLHFPINPEPDYIDGSIYLQNAHHPIEVEKIAFGELAKGGMPAKIYAKMILSHEGLGNYEDTPWEIKVILSGQALTAK